MAVLRPAKDQDSTGISVTGYYGSSDKTGDFYVGPYTTLGAATDTSDIDVYAGGIALAFGRSGGDGKKKEGKSKAFTLGASIAVNVIDNDLYAKIDAAKVNSAGNVELLATSTPSIETLTIAGAIAAAGGEGGGFSFAGAGAGSGNIIKNTVEAGIKNGAW